MGRKFGADELHLIILSFLAKNPAHGYELMKLIEDHSKGFYSPSPGMIYPALNYLLDTGFVTMQQDGTKKLYLISPEGQAHHTENDATVKEILNMLERFGSRMDDVRDAFQGGGVHGFPFGISEEVFQARQALRHALKTKFGCDAKESKRIADILKRAASEILAT
jgi:DNA-binding PadR family transcriptional regulator